MAHLIASTAQLDRELIRDRGRVGLARVKATGHIRRDTKPSIGALLVSALLSLLKGRNRILMLVVPGKIERSLPIAIACVRPSAMRKKKPRHMSGRALSTLRRSISLNVYRVM